MEASIALVCVAFVGYLWYIGANTKPLKTDNERFVDSIWLNFSDTCLRLDEYKDGADARCLALAKTHHQISAMFAERAILKPVESEPDPIIREMNIHIQGVFISKLRDVKNKRAAATANTFFETAELCLIEAVHEGDFTKEPVTSVTFEPQLIGDAMVEKDMMSFLYKVQAEKQVDARLIALAITNAQSGWLWTYFATR